MRLNRMAVKAKLIHISTRDHIEASDRNRDSSRASESVEKAYSSGFAGAAHPVCKVPTGRTSGWSPPSRCGGVEGADGRRRENSYVKSSHRASPPKMPPENDPSRATRAMATFVGLGIIDGVEAAGV